MVETSVDGTQQPPEQSRPSVLYLVHRVPYPPDKGDRIRAFHLLRFISLHANVHLATLADEPVREEVQRALDPYCGRLAVVPLGARSRWVRALSSLAMGATATEGAFSSPKLRAVLRQWAAETRYDLVLASASSMVPYCRMPELCAIPAVVDLVDVDSQKWLDYADASRPPRRWLYRLEGRRLRRLEQDLPSWARAVTLVSETEADVYRRFARPGVIRGISQGVDLDYFRPDADPGAPDGPTCVFVGALDYRPNVDGACYFSREVWPRIRQVVPGARLSLVGRQPVPAVLRLAEIPGVEVVGQVPDVRPYVARAAVTVVPLRIARGIQNKILEALAMARPVIASPAALEGLHAKPGTHLLSATTDSQWVETVQRLFADPDLGQRLGAAGRGYVEAHHSWDRCLEPLLSLMAIAPFREPVDGAPPSWRGGGALPATVAPGESR